MHADPERRMLRRPVVALIKASGGVDPDSQLAGELRHMGITHKTVPGIFRRGGRGALDNLPKGDCALFAELPCDGNGYVPEETILAALRDEMFGQPWRTAEELEAIESWRALQEAEDDRFGLAAASEEMGIIDQETLETARNLLITGTERDPWDALERAVMLVDEPDPAERGEDEIPFPSATRRKRKDATMSPDDLKAARRKLGLTVAQMAVLLGVEAQHVRRMEMQPGKEAHRPIRDWTARLVRAYLDGYRPADWPAD